jgi:hypothetical protein
LGRWRSPDPYDFDGGGVTFSGTENIIDTTLIMFTVQGGARSNGFPQIAIDSRRNATDGKLFVTRSDRCGDPKNRQQIVILARFTDGGRTLQNYPWTDKSFDAQGVFVGDYTCLSAFAGRIFGIWTKEPDDKSSKDTLVQIGLADFNDENAAAIPTARSNKDSG